MIISASRRTDIPAYYSEWFFNRLKEGFVFIRNPMNIHQVGKVILSPDVVDCIVFWSKNPKPMLNKLDLLSEYTYYFQFTLNSYAQDIETGLPRKKEIINTFKSLSSKIGPEKVIWRYDPILLNEKYTIDYHVENFAKIANYLKGYTEKVTISFIDLYSKITKNIARYNITEISDSDKQILAKQLETIAKENKLTMDTCAEGIDLSLYEITHARCIDNRLIERITSYELDIAKDKSQRFECGCVVSVDIGAYNSCSNACLYCYANYSHEKVAENIKLHNPNSPLLIGELQPDDVVVERNLKRNKIPQQELFDMPMRDASKLNLAERDG
ncbi:MAG: DUF1848 domain-containing protein [Spirochaetaceae bacterium]|jgi:DNA repair photolyase|nr:DUF1848 domain-containing protein [Spirochaetaceae bacterium]